MKFTIRPLGAEDLPAAARLERLCFSCPWPESVLMGELENGCLFWGALVTYGLSCEKNNKKTNPYSLIPNPLRSKTALVGYVSLKIAADEGYVGNLATDPDFRRRGIGQALVFAVLEHAREQCLAFVTLEVRVSNAAARALYEKNGFKLVGIRPGFYSKPVEDAAIYTIERLNLRC